MKKIFRMALVFALAGATLMYTGCSKDYDEDINNVKTSVNDLQNKLGDLNNELSALKSSVSSLESAYKAADDLIKGDVSDLKAKVAKLEDAVKDLSKYATKDELNEAIKGVEKKITDAKAEIKAVTDDLQKQINDLKEKLAKDEEALKKLEEAQKEVDNVYGFLSDELRAIVFFPDFYFAGVEATSYDFATFWGYKPVALGKAVTDKTDHNGAKLEFPKGAKTTAEVNVKKNIMGQPIQYAVDLNTASYIYDEKGNMVEYKDAYKYAKAGSYTWFYYYPANFSQGQIGRAYYDLNPSSFPLDSAEWSLNGMDRNYIVKADESIFWDPVFEGISKVDGHAEVLYTIDDPTAVFASVIDAFSYGYARGSVPENSWDTQAEYRRYLIKSYTDYLLNSYSHLPVMQLQADLDDDRSIVSDWHALSAGEELVDHLAFDRTNKWVTENEEDCGAIFNAWGMPLVKDLYEDAYDAAAHKPSVQVLYNGGPVDLAKLIAIHTNDTYGDAYNDYTLEEFNAKYPSFSYKFELVPYTVGGEVTSEEKYGQISGTEFTPCYVVSKDKNASSKPIEKGSESKEGISAVGRMPIVLAYLVNNETGESYAVGFFKIEIVKEIREAEERFVEIPDLGKVPFICNPFTLRTTWHEFSYFVLEALEVDYKEFIEDFELSGIYGYEQVAKFGSVVTELTEIKPAAADEEVHLTFSEAYVKDPVNNIIDYKDVDYGYASYNKDESGSTINDAFTWKVDPQDIGAGQAKSIYFKFINKADKYDIVFIEMKADVAAAAKFNFGANKIANEWFDDIDGEVKNTARINVLVPNEDGDDVTDFYRDLNRFFKGYKPSMVITDDTDPVYQNYFDEKANAAKKEQYNPEELEGEFTFYFSKEQPVIKNINDYTSFWIDADGKKMTTDLPLYSNWWDDSSKLYVPEYKWNAMKKAYEIVTEKVELEDGTKVTVPSFVESNLIATLEPTGKVTYYYAEGQNAAKVLLNLWSYTLTDQAKMLYGNVLVTTTYGECEIPAGDANFHLRFVRPLDVNFKDADVAQESAVNGFNVLIAEFISGITDWNKQNVIVPEPQRDSKGNVVKDKNGKIQYTGYYEENIISGVHMYQYYGFTKLILDLDNAERDHFKIGDDNARDLLKNVTPEAQLQLGTVDPETDIFTPGGSNELDITDLANLKGAAINYRNDRAVVETFNLFIPVSVEYAWGTITEILTIKVKKTADTDPA